MALQLAFTDEQEQFREMIRRFAAERSPPGEVRRLMETESGFDPAVWQQLATELGLTALQIPESHGGAGFGAVELGMVCEEFGRVLFCAPWFSSAVLATRLILETGSASDHDELLPGLADGSRRGTVAMVEADDDWDPRAAATVAERNGDGWRLTGRKHFVVDGASADFLLVTARENDVLGVYLVEAGREGLDIEPLTVMDPTRKLARVTLQGVAARRLGPATDATAAIRRTMDLGAVALAGEMVGGAQALLDASVAYAKMRVQFGRTIGSFQAIKHKCADMLLDVESARSAAYAAAAAMAEGDPEAPALACLAKAAASETCVRTAAEAIQIHGGIGFTWENDTHLWFKRARSSEVLLGDPTWHREQLMQRWGY